ncbi:hypothetical protein [Selenomonas felix]|uniref:hypothetical protein n=1 Tax=Selenomonas felix TaxID=1944634 RepID=UPI002357C587|nr:hypothetical protein [Selenomonas felix]
MKKLLLLCMAFALLALAGGCGGERADEAHGAQLVYAQRTTRRSMYWWMSTPRSGSCCSTG